jgi:16S rRNA (uracil1498-N3)-methyltransferase
MPRFYIDMPLSCGQSVTLHGAILRHLHVLRLDAGDVLTLFNGRGGEYDAVVRRVEKRTAEVELTAFHCVSRESELHLTLVQALSAADRMDYTIQKAAECGVHTIQPVISARCQSRLGGEQAEKKRAHWQAVAVSASEQCGRTQIPIIQPIQKLFDYINAPNAAELKILLSPTGAILFNQLPNKAQRIQVLIGPEGGFDADEESYAMAAGFIPLILGPRLFRTETVAPVITSLLQYRYGDFG